MRLSFDVRVLRPFFDVRAFKRIVLGKRTHVHVHIDGSERGTSAYSPTPPWR